MIKKIWLNTWSDYNSKTIVGDEEFLELGKVNLFIGRNNSGKSRLIRLLCSTPYNSFNCILEGDSFATFKNESARMLPFLPDNAAANNISAGIINHIRSSNVLLSNINRIEAIKLIAMVPATKENVTRTTGHPHVPQLQKYLRDFHVLNNRDLLESQLLEFSEKHRIYIPILRGMRPVIQGNNPPYQQRTIKDYFDSDSNKVDEIYTGEHLFNVLREHLLGVPEQREKISRYEELLSEQFFEGQSITLIPKHDDDVVNVKIGADAQHPIHHLGDGLQQIIIITSAVFLTEAPSLIMIEEPETCLHPGLLRQLMNFLIEDTDHQYFITTHSNHLLEFSDERSDTSAHRLSKKTPANGDEQSFTISTVTQRDRNLLHDLGVKGSSVYLANCTIWVEGITDRRYIQTYLKKYIDSIDEPDLKNYLENYHYSFVEYQGGNLSHWSFSEDEEDSVFNELNALSVSTPIFLIADGDIRNKANRSENLREQLHEGFYLLDGKEIENLIPENILKSTAIKLFENFTRETYDTDITKIEALRYADYVTSAEGIGYHLDRKLGLNGKSAGNARLIFAANSGTIKDKMKFCTIATDLMSTEEWELTDKIIDLCEKILSHIKHHNEI